MAATAHLHHQPTSPYPASRPVSIQPSFRLRGDATTPRSARRPVSPPVSQSARPNGSVVYWRRRIAVGVLLALLGAGLWTVAGWATNFSAGVAPVGADRTDPLPHEIVIVQPGDTLWSIAADLAPSEADGDLRGVVDRLAELNGGSAIEAGQRLVIDR